jgi:signal transduction histidine kinase
LRKSGFILSLTIGTILILVSGYGYLLLDSMPWLPEEAINRIDRSLESTNVSVTLDGVTLRNKGELEFILCRRISRKQAGDRIVLEVASAERSDAEAYTLSRYFEQKMPFPLFYLVIAVFSILIAVVAFVLRRSDPRARLFYWAILTFSTANVLTGGFHILDTSWVSFIPALLFYVCYALAPAILLDFSLAFAPDRPKISRAWIYAPAVMSIFLVGGVFLSAGLSGSIAMCRRYQSVFYFFSLYVIAFILASIVNFVRLYRKSPFEEIRARIKWILFGLCLGLGPFVLLYKVPKILKLQELVSMEVAMAFSLFIPIAIGIAILRYRFLDIEFVINRSLVYSILTVLVVGVYILLVRFLQNMMAHVLEIQDTAVSAVAAFGAALIFHPARKRIQEFVDRSFFRLSYDYRKSIRDFALVASREINPDHLAGKLERQIQETLGVETICVLTYIHKNKSKRIFILKGEGKPLRLIWRRVRNSSVLSSRKRAVSTEEGIDFSHENLLEAHNLELVIPFVFTSQRLSGFLALGKKKSRERYGSDDLALLSTLAQEFSINLERIRLQEEVVFERAEKEKLDELNRLKTEFISAVSHELRTPMSTLHNLADILQANKIKEGAQRDKLLKLMAEECARLSHFLHNILDAGRIERDSKHYNMVKTDLSLIVMDVAKLFEHRLAEEGFVMDKEVPPHPVELNLDPDAVKQALTNLLDNAIKYSTDQKEIRLRLVEKSECVVLAVEDKGIGMAPREINRIFEGFFRGAKARLQNPSGVGIGLKLVKHIMHAHGGTIELNSRSGQGSVFRLVFPKS